MLNNQGDGVCVCVLCVKGGEPTITHFEPPLIKFGDFYARILRLFSSATLTLEDK